MLAAAKNRKPVILCIEDNEDHLRLRRQVLENNGYLVVGATTAAAAFEVLRRRPVSLVISDHLLGATTGTELAKDIRNIQPLVPILLYAGVMPEHLGDVNCFLSKAEPVESLLRMVASLVDRYLE